MTAPRFVKPEILDSLPEDSPSARRSRRDLRIINRVMGNSRWLLRTLTRCHREGEGVLEIGAGEGDLGRRLTGRGVAPVAAIDLAPRPRAWPEGADWHETSVFDFNRWEKYPVVIGNLVFHHFKENELGVLGEKISRHARLIVANEPLRSKKALRGFSLLCPLIGADPVTRHDGRVSIEAGFFGDELPQLLRLDPKVWTWRVEVGVLAAYRLIAERRS